MRNEVAFSSKEVKVLVIILASPRLFWDTLV
jgi:hypothetical protein